jgi:hypothetical protein
MHTKEQLIEKRQELNGQLQQAAAGIQRATAVFNQVQGAAVALDLLIAEYDKPAEKKPAKKGKK